MEVDLDKYMRALVSLQGIVNKHQAVVDALSNVPHGTAAHLVAAEQLEDAKGTLNELTAMLPPADV